MIETCILLWMSLLHLTKHKIFPSSDAWFYLNINKYFLTNIIFFLLYRQVQWENGTFKESLGQLLFSLSGNSLFTKPRLSLWVLPHKTQSYEIKIPNLPKQEYRPEQFYQSINDYKKLFLAPFSYHVMIPPQSVFQNPFFKIPSKKTSETTPASLLTDQVTTSPWQKPTSIPLTSKTAAEVSSVITRPQTSSAPLRVYTTNTKAETTQTMTLEHCPTTATACEQNLKLHQQEPQYLRPSQQLPKDKHLQIRLPNQEMPLLDWK